jgi:hypothetical protein
MQVMTMLLIYDLYDRFIHMRSGFFRSGFFSSGFLREGSDKECCVTDDYVACLQMPVRILSAL